MSQNPIAPARSDKVSDIDSVGRLAQMKTIEVEPPIIMANKNSVLLALYLITSSGWKGSPTDLESITN
jgi:hypothetical protein